LVLVGDFNDEPAGPAYKLMLSTFDDSWIRSGARLEELTYPADKPIKRIDYIFTRRSDRIKAKKAWIVNTLASDHLPVVVDLEIR
ncbi:MAG: endonuclease/exonuclease/phosphatase family protein, partial [Pyrinomonadaceae bacterium]